MRRRGLRRLQIRVPPSAMVDTLISVARTGVARTGIGGVIGRASAEDMLPVARALAVTRGIG